MPLIKVHLTTNQTNTKRFILERQFILSNLPEGTRTNKAVRHAMACCLGDGAPGVERDSLENILFEILYAIAEDTDENLHYLAESYANEEAQAISYAGYQEWVGDCDY
jgi:hypothetical protein